MKYQLKTILKLLILFTLVSFHGPYHEQINRITKQIQANPQKPHLYLQRAQLYELDTETIDSAFLDYKHLLAIDSNMSIANYLCARLYLNQASIDSARCYIDRYLTARPQDANGQMLKAAILLSQGHYEASVSLFNEIIQKANPKVDYFLNLAEATYQYAPDDSEKVLYWLRQGLIYLPNNISLMEAIIDKATQMGEYEIAFKELEKVMQFFQREEKWYFKKAQILIKQERIKEAVDALEACLLSIEQLPRHIQKTPFVVDLETNAILLLTKYRSP